VDLINALGIVFPQYWESANCQELFPLHLEVLQKFYCAPREILGEEGVGEEEPNLVTELLNRRDLDNQASIFKATMIK
jgi:hypothetical protein